MNAYYVLLSIVAVALLLLLAFFTSWVIWGYGDFERRERRKERWARSRNT